MAVDILGITYALVAAATIYLVWSAVVFYMDYRRRMWQLRNVFCPPHNWLLGHVLDFPGPTEEGLAFLRQKCAENPRMALIKFGPFHYALSCQHPDVQQVIFKASVAAAKANYFGPYHTASYWLGNGLLLSKGAKWARNRRLLTPAFHFDILKPYVAIKNKATEVLMSKLDSFCREGDYFEAFSHVSLCTLDIILRCAFSYENDCQLKGDHHPYVKAVEEMGNEMFDRVFSPWLYNDFIYFLTPQGRRFKKNCDYVHSVSEDVIANRRKALESSPEALKKDRKYLDFLDILLVAKDEEGIGLTDQEIRDEVDTFLFEGHDTTASGISWTLHSLASHPDIQRRCQQEVDEILAGRDDDTLLWEDLGQLTYLTMCIKESMRLHTTVPFIERETQQDLELEGNTIPKGSLIDLHLYLAHHNPLIWENSLEYKPERFLPEHVAKRHPYAFVPFSAGSRNCIGQHFAMDELKIVIGRILRRFNLELDPNHEARQRISVVMKAENGIRMKVTPRSRT